MTAPHDFGPRPQYADLPVAELAVDSSYQRSIEARRNQAAIERICENFRWSLFGIVTVTKGLTGYLIIDGQHRTEAARRLKIQSVPCLIVPPLSRQDQALAFVAANRDRVAVTQFAIHHALAAAGDAKAGALQTMCEAAGVEIPRYPIPSSTMKPGQTLAIGALTSFLDALGHDRAVVLLHAVRGAFSTERGALRAPLISALAEMDVAEPIDTSVLIRALMKTGLKAFEKECSTLLLDAASRNRTQAAVTVISRLIGRSSAPTPTITPSVKPAPVKAAPPPGSETRTGPAQADSDQRRAHQAQDRAEPRGTGSGDRQLCRDQGCHEMPAGRRGTDRGAPRVEIHARGSDACATAGARDWRERQPAAGEDLK